MSVRIRYQSMTALAALGPYADALRQHARAIASGGTTVEFRGLDPALYGDLVPGDVFPYPYAKHLIGHEALEACWQAARDGCDAFVIGSFSEPLLRQSRSAVDIPVLSLAESAFLTACSLAERFALVTLSPAYARRLSEVVARHGMTERVAAILPLGDSMTEREASDGLDRPDAILRAFRSVAARAIEAGADLLIPSEGILNEVLHRHGAREMEGATVMDCVGVALLDVERHVAMRRRLGLGPGRAWSYPLADPALIAQLRRNLGRPD